MRRLPAATAALTAALAAAGCVYEPKGRCDSAADCGAGETCNAGVCVETVAVAPVGADPTSFTAVSWTEHLGTTGTSFRVDGVGADLAGNVVVAGTVDPPFDFGPGLATSGAFAVQLASGSGAPQWATFFPTFSHGRFEVAVAGSGETFFAGTAFARTSIGTVLVDYDPPPAGALVLGKLDGAGQPVWAIAAPNGAASAALAPVSLAVHGGDVLVAGTGALRLDPCPATTTAGSGAATFVAALDGATGACRWARGLLNKAITSAVPADSGTVTIAGACQPVGASFDPGDGTTCAKGLYLAALDGTTGATLWARRSAGTGSVAAVRDLAVAPDGRATVIGDANGAIDFGAGAVNFGNVSDRSFAQTFTPAGATTTLVRALEHPEAASPDVAAFSRAVYDRTGRLWIAGRYEGEPVLGGVRFSACRPPGCGAATFLVGFEADGATVSPAGGFLPVRAAPDASDAAFADDLVLCATTGTVAHALRLSGDARVGNAPSWTGAAGDLAAVRIAP